jgi:hypothetical protein
MRGRRPGKTGVYSLDSGPICNPGGHPLLLGMQRVPGAPDFFGPRTTQMAADRSSQ